MTTRAIAKTTVELPVSLMRQIRQAAVDRGIAMKTLLIEAISVYLTSPRKADRSRFRLRDASVSGTGLQPGVDLHNWEQVRGLIYEGRGE